MNLTPDWEAISAIGQLVGAVGVIFSLIFVGFQIRADARARRTATMHQHSMAFANLCLVVSTSDGLVNSLERPPGGADPKITAAELRVALYFSAVFRTLEDAFFQHREGNLDERIWRGTTSAFGDFLKMSGAAQWWVRHRHEFAKEFQAFVDGAAPSQQPASTT